MPKYSPLELSVILRAYVELGVMNRDLVRGLDKICSKTVIPKIVYNL